MAFPEDFEWDETKRRANLSKHGIDFEDIVRLFDSVFIEDPDRIHSDLEDRYLALGILEGIVYCVALTYREDRRRLISARRATPAETREFYSRLFGERLS